MTTHTSYPAFPPRLCFLPSIAWFRWAVHIGGYSTAEDFFVRKKNFFNKGWIKGANNIQLLSIPLAKGGRNMKYAQITLANSTSWRTKMKQAIQSAYGKSPFFEYYRDELFCILDSDTNRLEELNKACLVWLCRSLEIDLDILPGTPALIQEERAAKACINKKEAIGNTFATPVYYQPFGDFAHNMSSIDLLFNEGRGANEILKAPVIR